VDLRILSEQFRPSEDQSWLGSAHATDTGDTITLDVSTFSEFGDVIPSGVVVTRLETGLYGRYTGAEGQEAAGHLLTTKAVKDDQTHLPAALLWHGQVLVARLPEGHGLDAGAVEDLGQINYVGEVS